MDRHQRSSRHQQSDHFRNHLLVFSVFYVILTLFLTLWIDVVYLELLGWIGAYIFLSFFMSLIAIVSPKFVRWIFMALSMLMLMFLLILMTKNTFDHQMYLSILFVCFSLGVGLIAKLTLIDQIFLPKLSSKISQNHSISRSTILRNRLIRRANIKASLKTKFKAPGYRN